ncbi:MAG: pyridoxal 5'-phosphate synthase glutaminase subunit PdxT, partial [Solirubrobacterales bacterium]
MALGIEREGLAGPLQDFCSSGRPVLATCAGMII